MSMLFGHYSVAAIEENPDLRAAASRERGEVTRPVSRAEMDDRLCHGPTGGLLIPDDFRGCRIDLKPGEFTEEEIEEIRAGKMTVLDYGFYGTKWRLWEGWPTDEQMAAEPWEETA